MYLIGTRLGPSFFKTGKRSRIFSEKNIEKNEIEIKMRRTSEIKKVNKDKIVKEVKNIITDETGKK